MNVFLVPLKKLKTIEIMEASLYKFAISLMHVAAFSIMLNS